MLDVSATDIVRTWLERALEAGATAGKTAAGLARHCQVKPQAVTGWRRTGRISKVNLARAEVYFGHGPSFLHGGAPRVAAPAPPPADFHDGDQPTESDWQLLRDLRWIPQDERDALRAQVHERATRQRAHTEEIIRRLKRETGAT